VRDISKVTRKKRALRHTQPPYPPDLAPADFFLFPKHKSTLKGRRFESIEAIKTNSLAHLRSIPKNSFPGMLQNIEETLAEVHTE
jgi:transposase